MYGYKTAVVQAEEFTCVVDLKLNGDWVARNDDDNNALCELAGLEAALSRALESESCVGVSKNKLVTVTVSL
jgi:hypothetical protein